MYPSHSAFQKPRKRVRAQLRGSQGSKDPFGDGLTPTKFLPVRLSPVHSDLAPDERYLATVRLEFSGGHSQPSL